MLPILLAYLLEGEEMEKSWNPTIKVSPALPFNSKARSDIKILNFCILYFQILLITFLLSLNYVTVNRVTTVEEATGITRVMCSRPGQVANFIHCKNVLLYKQY
jgi:hypothetical protein